jgi:hypothetical protein
MYHFLIVPRKPDVGYSPSPSERSRMRDNVMALLTSLEIPLWRWRFVSSCQGTRENSRL